MRSCKPERSVLFTREPSIISEQRTAKEPAWTANKGVTRRERFFGEMDAEIPWTELVAFITPVCPKRHQYQSGRPAVAIGALLRIYFLQHWFDLSDPAAEDALYDSEAMRHFVSVEIAGNASPDETTILLFRHLLEAHRLIEELFEAVCDLFEAKGLLLTAGTIVDPTFLRVSSSTKNAIGTRSRTIKQTQKGKVLLRDEGPRGLGSPGE